MNDKANIHDADKQFLSRAVQNPAAKRVERTETT